MRNNYCPTATAMPGSLHRSQGYRDKVLDNPVMQTDAHGRDAPLQFTCDGTPIFKDQNAGSSLFGSLTHGALDARLQKDPDLAHLSLVIPSYYYGEDEDGVVTRIKGYNELHIIGHKHVPNNV